MRVLPPSTRPGAPTLGARFANVLLAFIAVVVSCVGRLERLLHGTGGMSVRQIREATLDEVARGAGGLAHEKHLLPSAYEVWVGPRPDGHLRLRYTYDQRRLASLLSARGVPATTTGTGDEAASGGTGGGGGGCSCVPLALDVETTEWVTAHVTHPAPGTRLHVWRALKRRLYHYDAGVVASPLPAQRCSPPSSGRSCSCCRRRRRRRWWRRWWWRWRRRCVVVVVVVGPWRGARHWRGRWLPHHALSPPLPCRCGRDRADDAARAPAARDGPSRRVGGGAAPGAVGCGRRSRRRRRRR